MREVGATADELLELERAIDTSDKLHQLQKVAIAAMAGRYDPVAKDYVERRPVG